MATWRADVYPQIVAELVKKRGAYDGGVPRMQLADMVAVLGTLSASLALTVKRTADRIPRSDFATADGMLNLRKDVVALSTLDEVSAETYLFRCTRSKSAWRRTLVAPTDAQRSKAAVVNAALTYEPVRDPSAIRDEQLKQIAFLRQAIDYYDRALAQVESAMVVFQSNALSGVTGRAVIEIFLKACRQLGDQMDSMDEHPPTTLSQDVKGALGYALDKSAEATVEIAEQGGRAAAWAANQAGRVASSALGGFLDGANLATLAVVGVVGVVMLKRYGVV